MAPNKSAATTCGPIHDDEITPVPELQIVDYPQPHKGRRKALEAAHPELADLSHPRIDSSLYVWAAVLIQTAAAFAVAKYDFPWWGVFALAYTVGATCDHMLWVLIHELTHDAVFESTTWNKIYHCISNFPIFFPAAISFRHYHRLHHSHLNEAWGDPDIPGVMENKIFGTSAIGKATWLLFFALIQSVRVTRFGPSLGGAERWMAVNWVTQVAYNVVMWYFTGWTGVIYLIISSMFSIGLHPLGARWIAEHYSVRAPQETYSYYGFGNVLSLNVGYHNEHHDLPNVPWQHLPKVRAIAPEFYETMWYHTSYLRLLWHFITDPKFTLATRTVRLTKARTPYLKQDKAAATDEGIFEEDEEPGAPTPTPHAADAPTSTASSGSKRGLRSRPSFKTQ